MQTTAPSANEQRLIDALQFIVRETMDYPPLPPASTDSYLPAQVIEFAQNALATYSAAIAPSAPAALPVITSPTLQPGDHYAGIVLDASGTPTHHLVLMAAQPEADLAWQAAMDWAASVGGALPTRQEQALLFANCKPHLQPYWHWSCETVDGSASYAGLCYFSHGGQHGYHKSYEGSVVAVRRLPINPSIL